MFWKNWPSWLKGGAVVVLLYTVASLFVVGFSYLCQGDACWAPFGWALALNIFSTLILVYLVDLPPVFIRANVSLFVLYFFISVVIYFIIGSLIGFLIGRRGSGDIFRR